ncbi:dephospho-CoA kinase [Chlorobaculum thiosulfatiphilum]|uniref:Dephospho-CoA kinase n=1 Tax=Chlorobaculum thiosulfatiphilum TaxID=115852 RepID=A0A5C4SBN0_CHLTI|nr:dephospho-CoA kinase [Chlorobaculum thiosulfatiphilum]TNJ40329.1 dephospho-CoA kinase [Chlorobaculum thiosulfatiphilum]
MERLPLLVGVTGGIGSGKSTVCAMLAGMGCELFEADRIAKELQLEDLEVIRGIEELFGSAVYSRDGSGKLHIDRKAIASVVFSDPERLAALNRLIHPKVREAFVREVKRCAREGKRILCKEAAILFEVGADRDLDRIIVVAANDGLRLDRVVARGLGREEARKRMAAQWPQERLIERAHYVIFNDGTLEELRSQVEQIYRSLVTVVEYP